MKNKSLIALLLVVVAFTCLLGACSHTHEFGSWVVTKQATCTEDGQQTRSCKCGEKETQPISALGHDEETHQAQVATCQGVGWQSYVTCKREGCDYSTYSEIAATGHTAGQWITDVEPTCTTEGSKHQVCVTCGETLKTEKIPVVAHSFGAWMVVEASTCAKQGYEERSCSCGETETRDIALAEHIGGQWITDFEPTCTTEGSKHQVCATCGETIKTEVIDELAHSYQTAVTDPTCTEQGYSTHTCSVCGDSFVDTYVDALGHVFGDWKIVEYSTCAKQGYEERKCFCGESETRELELKNHTMTWVTDKEPTYDETGLKHQECSVCGAKQSENTVIPVKTHEHNYVVTETTNPTCTQNGAETFTCTICQDTYTNDIAALGHSYQAAVTDPTCTEQGYSTHTCSVCGDSYVDSFVVALGHSFGDWMVVEVSTCAKQGYEERSCFCGETETRDIALAEHIDGQWITDVEPTCTAEGSKHQVCVTCGETIKTEVIDALGHSYQTAVTDPTCTEQGYSTHTCSVCGDSYVDSFVDALGHDEIVHEAKAPTCTEIGWDAYVTCGRCDYTTYATIAATGVHSYTKQVVEEQYLVSEATTQSPAVYHYSCECGAEGQQTFTYGEVLDILIESITLDKTELVIGVGETYQLKATILPANATEDIFWASADESVVKVENGLLTAVKEGQSYVGVITESGLYAICVVEVKVPVQSITFSSKYAEIYIGQPFTLEPTILPANAPKDLLWMSSNETVATVNENGVITALNTGTTIIGATSWNGVSSTCSVTVKAGEIQFELTEDSSFYYVTGYVGYARNVVIPNMHDGLRVIRIAESAFKGNASLESITLPNTIQILDAHAFEGCVALKNITIPDSVKQINAYTFANCTSLESITINKNLTSIDEYAFANCTHLSSITVKTVDAKLNSIGSYAFSNCKALTSFDISQYATSLTTIGDHAFSNCTALQSVVLPDSVTTICASAFEYCTALKQIDLGQSLVTIADKAFDYCAVLESVEMPNTVTTLGNMAFRHNDMLKEVAFSTSLVTIGNAAFQYCISIEELILPPNITQLGNSTFSYCEGLKTLLIMGNITSWGDSTFYECGKLENLYIASQTYSAISTDNYIFYNAGSKSNGITLIFGPGAVIPEGLFIPVDDENSYPRIVAITATDDTSTFTAFEEINHLPYLTAVSLPNSIQSVTYGIFNNSPWWDAQQKGVVYIDNYFYGYKCDCQYCTPTDVVVENYVDSDCVNDGSYDNVVTCTTCCYEVLRETIVIPAKGHTPLEVVVENYVDSDCVNDGSCDNVVYCGVCEDELSRETIVIPAKGHTPLEVVVENYVDSDCVNDGSYDNVVYCGVCEDEVSRETIVIPAKGHKLLKMEDVETTVQNYTVQNATNYPFAVSGNQIVSTNKVHGSSATYTITMQRTFVLELQYKVSSEGGCDYLTIKHNSTQKAKMSGTSTSSFTTLSISVKEGDTVTITYSKDSSQSKGSDCAWVNLITPATETVAEQQQKLVDATEENIAQCLSCTEDVLCAVCSAILVEELGHDYIHHEAQAETCTQVGWQGYNTCSRCDYTDYVEISALGHDYIHHEGKEPTCAIGWQAYDTCSRCDYSTYVEIPANTISHDVQNGYCVNCNLAESTPGLKYSQNSNGSYAVTGIGACTATDIIIGIYNNKSVTSIGNRAFLGCSSLTSITIGDSVTSIGNYAFEGCSSLTSITIPDGVRSIGEDAFYSCSSLTNVYITDIASWCNISFSSSSANPLDYADNLYVDNQLVTELVIPDSVTSIGDYAFYDRSSLTSITIPDSVTSIGSYAFYNCSSLTSITIPDGVRSIGEDAFYSCSSLTNVYITDIASWCNISFSSSSANPLDYADNLYVDNQLVTELVIPDGVTSIGDYAFSGCSSLTSITIPDSVTSIGSYAFRDCSSLTSITIPDSVTSIGSSAFYRCSSLTSITIPDSVTSIGSDAFYNCSSLTNVYISDIASWCNKSFSNYYANPLYYADNLYVDNQLVTELVIPDSVTSIGYSAFRGFSSLTSVTIPDSVTSIGNYAFYACSSLTSITIPDSVTSIGSSAFYRCSSLTSITIPDSVTSIGSDAFYNCSSLTNVYISDIASWCNISFGNYSANPLCYADNLYVDNQLVTELVILESVTSIGKYAFYGCSSLTSITIPDSVTSIGSSAFSGCSDLTSVTIGNSVTSIGYYAFDGCSSLTNVYYTGTETKWTNITIGSYNSKLTNATRYYYSECIYGSNQWRYDNDGNISTELTIGEGIVDVEATCTTTGSKHAICSVCGETITLEIPALGHSIGTDGMCTVCGEEIPLYTITNDATYAFVETDGVLQSTNKANSSSSSYVITANTTITITFEYNVSSESGYDKFYILHNSTQKVVLSGTSNSYTSYSITLNAGDTLTFKYTKDSSSSSGDDCCYIKNLTITTVN